MWFKNILRPRPPHPERATPARGEPPLFDEAFLRRMERLSLQAQRSLRGNPSSGQHLSRHQIPTSVFNDHRPYVHGDDLRYVDWNAYARQDHMLLKLGEAEQDVHIHVLIDASRSMAWGRPAKLRLACQLAGAIGFLAMAHSDRLHIASFGAGLGKKFGPVQGKARMIEMLRFIERTTVQQQTALGPVLDTYARRHPQGGILVLCSDLLAAEGLDNGLRLLMPPRWQVLVLHLLDPRELKPELQGPLELEDGESGQRLEVILDDETLNAYRRNVATWQERLARNCARRGATYTQLLTTWPLEQKIVPYLRTRRLLT